MLVARPGKQGVGRIVGVIQVLAIRLAYDFLQDSTHTLLNLWCDIDQRPRRNRILICFQGHRARDKQSDREYQQNILRYCSNHWLPTS